MPDLQIIVFSYNRALQLDTLLSSLIAHWKSPSFVVDIIYNTSGNNFQEGYKKLENKFTVNKNFQFHKESNKHPDRLNYLLLFNYFNYLQWRDFPVTRHPKTNFKSLTIDLMKQSDPRFVMFLTDDTMFVNDVSIDKQCLEWIGNNPKHNQISLRVGVGMDDNEANYENNGTFLSWNFAKEKMSTNWGYRFSVDAHIYDKDIIIKLLKRNIFVNPNTLEGPVCCDAIRQKWLENGRGPVKPSLLSFPINMVQSVIQNETLGVSAEALNQYYLDDYTLRYPIPDRPNHFQQYPKYLIMEKDGEEDRFDIHTLQKM